MIHREQISVRAAVAVLMDLANVPAKTATGLQSAQGYAYAVCCLLEGMKETVS